MTHPETIANTTPNHEAWPEFVLPWNDISTGPTDMSGLLARPAGADGFIQVVDGHLATGDGARWRFWGVGQVFAAFFPPTEVAGTIARRMAKFGINCIRLHHLDHRWPNGVLKRYDEGKSGPGIVAGGLYPHPGRDSTRELDPEAMARLDWFITCCKENGIYVDLNLNVSRQFSIGDGVKDVEYIGYAKGMAYFDERLIFLQKEYARLLLDHVNPFTGNRYADEPAIALVEIVNEQSLLEMWWTGKLKGEQTEPSRIARPDIPPSYAKDLDQLWNTWLMRRYDDRLALETAWEGNLNEYEDARNGSVRRLRPEEFAVAAAPRFRDEARFYAELERTFFQDMESYLRGDLGVKQLIVATSDWNQRYSSLAALEGHASQDVIDGHAYWHAHWSRPDRNQPTTPQVDAPDRSMPARLSRSIVEGYPYIVSEINESFPSDFACECIPMVAAYGLLQDWDGIFWHSYTGGHFTPDKIWQDPVINHGLRIGSDPMKMSQMTLGALMFLRGDIEPARQTVGRSMPYEWVLESTRVDKPDPGNQTWFPYLPGRLGLVHRTAITDFHAKSLSPVEGEVSLPEGAIVSDTGQLTWEDSPNDGRLIIDTPRHQAIIMRAGQRSTTNMRVDLTTPFAAVQLASLDDRPIAESERLLLVAAARVANTGMQWPNGTESATKLDLGKAPTRIEPVRATLTLKGPVDATGVQLRPLDGCGQVFGDPQPAVKEHGDFLIDLTDEPGTIWYVLEVQRDA